MEKLKLNENYEKLAPTNQSLLIIYTLSEFSGEYGLTSTFIKKLINSLIIFVPQNNFDKCNVQIVVLICIIILYLICSFTLLDYLA